MSSWKSVVVPFNNNARVLKDTYLINYLQIPYSTLNLKCEENAFHPDIGMPIFDDPNYRSACCAIPCEQRSIHNKASRLIFRQHAAQQRNP